MALAWEEPNSAFFRLVIFSESTGHSQEKVECLAHFALARVLQGLGLAGIFVPISQLAYSYIPKEKNNKASSLTNLFRNQGYKRAKALAVRKKRPRASGAFV